MSKAKNIAIAVFLLIAVLSGCTRRVMIRRYYLIEMDPAELSKIVKFTKSVDHSVNVRDFDVDRAYRQTSIVLRSDTHELNYYFYHYWAVRPGLAVADMVYSIVDNSRLFKNCYRGFSYKPDFVIRGHIQQMERVQVKKIVSAHVRGIIILDNTESGETILRYDFDKIVGLGNKNDMNSFVSVISGILFDETNEFLKKCAAHFNIDQPKND
ncbi:hypothetical protein J7K93_10615 [bacterium]|nr:hypothetical protein [bacterium]